MEGQSIREKYGFMFAQMAQVAHAAAEIDETNVFEPANPETRTFMDKLAGENLAEGSKIGCVENFEAFFDAIEGGKSGLILMEHYSNLDLPALTYLLEHSGSEKCAELSKRIIAIAGMKLNEESPMVRAFAESFTRVVIYPTRSLAKIADENERAAEEAKARKINLAAMKAMDNCKRAGNPILVFPSGTRYRPGKPETKRGLREIDSYLRLFDTMILVTINGLSLHIDPEHPDDMLADIIKPDAMVFTASPLYDCKSFRKEYMASLPETEADPKQRVIDHVMELFDAQHEAVEKTRA